MTRMEQLGIAIVLGVVIVSLAFAILIAIEGIVNHINNLYDEGE